MMTMWRQVGFWCGGCDLQHGTHWSDFYFLFSSQNPLLFFSFSFFFSRRDHATALC